MLTGILGPVLSSALSLIAATAAAAEPAAGAPEPAASAPVAPGPEAAPAPGQPAAPAAAAEPAAPAPPAQAEKGPPPEKVPVRDTAKGLTFRNSYFWVDSGLLDRRNAQAGQYNKMVNYMGGRFVLGAQYYREFGEFFGTAKVELIGFESELASSLYEAHTLDSFVMFGQRSWDIQAGRFLAWEVYHRGQGIDLYTAEESGATDGVSMAMLNLTRGPLNESGQAALHFYPFDLVGLELGGVYGQESNQNRVGLRPVLDVQLWEVNLRAGYEYLKQVPQIEADKVEVTASGWAAQASYHLALPGHDPAERRFPRAPNPLDLPLRHAFSVGLNAAGQDREYVNIQGDVDGAQSHFTRTFGGYADLDFWRNAVGLGLHRTTLKNKEGEEHAHLQAFVSYLFYVPVEGMTAKLVYGFAKADVQDVDTDASWINRQHSLRLRLGFEFK